MAIQDDFTIDYVDKKITHTANNNTYEVNAFYSWLMDVFDELTQMDNPVPMTAQTPTEYTMTNGWFVDNVSVKYLKKGAIKSDDWTDDILIVDFDGTYTPAIAGDIGKMVTDDAVNVGPLLYFDNGQKKWWVRDTEVHGAVSAGSAMAITGGTGAGTAAHNSSTGEVLYSGIYTLGTIANNPYPQLYIEQSRAVINNARNGNDWWARGHIDILVLVKEADTLIESGIITVLARQYGDLYDHYTVDLSAGGYNAVPIATSTDLDNDTPTAFMLYDAWVGDFTAGLIITGGTSGATAEIIEVIEHTANTNGVLKLGNIIGTYQDNETITDTSTGQASVNGGAGGCIGEVYLKYDQETGGPFSTGNTITGVTSGNAATLRGLQDDGLTGYMVLENPDGEYQITPTEEQLFNGGTAYCYIDVTLEYSVKSYEDYDDVLIRFVNGTLTYDNLSGTFTVGNTVTGATLSATGIILADTGSILTLGNVTGTFEDNESITDGTATALVNNLHGLDPAHTMNKTYELGSPYPYDAIIDLSGRYVSELYEYLKLFCSQPSTRSAYTFDSQVRYLLFALAGYTSCVESDIGKPVIGGTTGDGGTLLAYNNTTRIWTVLVDDPTGDWFDEAETVSVTGGTGTGTTEGCSYLGTQQGRLYKAAYDAYALKKASPFGTFAGGKFFGAQGIWIENMHADDVQNYSLIDANGTTRNPPNKQAITVTDLLSGDRVSVFRTTVGDVDKAMYTSALGNNAGDSDFVVTAAIDNDTPSGNPPDEGVLRLVDVSEGTEQRMRYASWATSTFTLITKISGNTTSAGGNNTINDTGATFLSENIRTGDIVRNSTDGAWAQVVSVDSDIKVTTTPLQGGGDNLWDNGDGYEFHTLPVTYQDGVDKAYVPYIDRQADATSEAITVVFVSQRNIMVRVRRKGIIPFELGTTFPSTGRSVAAIRNPDNIVT